jgi:hypothetical protein
MPSNALPSFEFHTIAAILYLAAGEEHMIRDGDTARFSLMNQ